MMQSSSPSYILMASIDKCVHMLDEEGPRMFEDYVRRLTELRKSLGGLKCLRLVETERYDWSKLVISVNGLGMTGRELYKMLLERYHLQMEMAAGTYVIAMTSVNDSGEGFERLQRALYEIDAELAEKGCRARDAEEAGTEKADTGMAGNPVNRQVMSCAEALRISDGEFKTEMLPWEEAEGRISAEYAYLYPPGSPLIVPGEQISPEAAKLLGEYRKAGFSIEGLERDGQIKVVRAGF